MEELKRKAIMLSLIEKMDKKGSWNGETHIQKVVYFLEQLLKVPLGYGFVLYKHGPYSFDLHDELIEMKANNLLDLKNNYPYGSSYEAGTLAETLKIRFPKTIGMYDNALGFITEKIANRKVVDLEKLATALYVISKEHCIEDRACAERINCLKPHINIEQAKEA